MYSYTFSNDDTEKITKKTKNYSNLLEGFKQIDDKFSYDTESLNLDKKTFTKPTDEQIKTQAENSLYDYKQSEISGIENNYDTKKANIDTQLQTTKSTGQTQKEEAKNLYSGLKKDASNDAVKRGLSRSSIVINILDAFDKNMIDEINKINQEISTKIDTLNNQKLLLDEQRQSALNSFDISYAVKLANKIDEINKNLKEEEQKVIEYNNQIAQKEAEYEAKRKQNTLDYAEFIEKNGQESLNAIKQIEKYELAKDYLSTLSKDEALKELMYNTALGSELGASYLNKLKILTNSRDE